MAKKSKIDTQISHEEINDALRFLKKGGEIQKVEYKDNGFLLKNDLALDDNYAESYRQCNSQLNIVLNQKTASDSKLFQLLNKLDG